MSTTPEKPREFWVLVTDYEGKAIVTDKDRECFDYDPDHADLEELCHVIEKSTFDVLKNKYDSTCKELGLNIKSYLKLKKDKDAEIQELQDLVTALINENEELIYENKALQVYLDEAIADMKVD